MPTQSKLSTEKDISGCYSRVLDFQMRFYDTTIKVEIAEQVVCSDDRGGVIGRFGRLFRKVLLIGIG